MQHLLGPELDDEQSHVLTAAYDLAWRRIIHAELIKPVQHRQLQDALYGYLLQLVRRGERKEARLARRGIFFICGILASAPGAYVPGQPLVADGTQIVF